MNVLLWLVIIVVVTFWHELGHYLAARVQGVNVKTFSIGMGSVLARWRARGTEWRLSALPIGGYVEIDGMAPTITPDGRTIPPTTGFARLGAPGKILILLAGPVFNIVLAIALFTAVNATQGVQTPLPDRARVEAVVPGSLAERVGVRTGDVIVGINGQDIPETETVDGEARPGYLRVRDTLASDGRKTFTIERAGQRRDVSFDWQATQNGERQRFGIQYTLDRHVRRVGIGGALVEATTLSFGVIPQALQAFKGIFQQFFTLDLSETGDVMGPVRTVGIVGQAAEAGVWTFVALTGAINLSLAFFNLLPIPGLDGGRILLVLVQAAMRRPLSFQQESLINLAGFVFVMLLMLFVVFKDLLHFVQ